MRFLARYWFRQEINLGYETCHSLAALKALVPEVLQPQLRWMGGWMSVGILLYYDVPSTSYFQFALPVANLYRQYPLHLGLSTFL